MPELETKKTKSNNVSTIKLILMFLSILGIVFLIYFVYLNKEEKGSESKNTCFDKKLREVEGTSMSPLLQNRETVTTFENYYDCNEIGRGDIIIFNFKTREGDYIKKIVGMPNDELIIEDNYIKINSEYVLNSEGNKYRLTNQEMRILTIPLTNNQIPRNGYLVLGDNTNSGIFDSRQFGYINRDQIIGKVNK